MIDSAPATAGDPGEHLSAYLAPQIVAEDLPALFPLLAAQPLLSVFSALFHGGLAAVQIRLLVLREIGQRSEAPRWPRREIDAHFAFLDATKLETAIKRLTEFGLLLWDTDDRTYRVSPQGHGALAALATLLWALIILPKRERQWSRQSSQEDEQADMFGAAKPLAAATDAAHHRRRARRPAGRENPRHRNHPRKSRR